MENTSPFRLLLTLLLLSLAWTAPAKAQDKVRYYDVELIIFERNGTAAAEMEFWPAVTKRPGAGISLFSDNPAVANSGFVPLGRNQQHLTRFYTSLARSPAYTPIVHMTWRQPGLDAKHAVPVSIRGGQQFPAPASISQASFSDGRANTVVGNTDATQTQPIAVQQPTTLRQLEGTVKVVLGRYLHVHTDLILRRLMPEGFVGDNRVGGVRNVSNDSGAAFQGPATTLHEFRMNQHRRMRSAEMHYIDHPMMGMIIIIRRAPAA